MPTLLIWIIPAVMDISRITQVPMHRVINDIMKTKPNPQHELFSIGCDVNTIHPSWLCALFRYKQIRTQIIIEIVVFTSHGFTGIQWLFRALILSISSILLFSEFFSIVKTHISFWISRLYLAGVAAAQLRWPLSNMDVVWGTKYILLPYRKFGLRRF